MKTYLIRLAIRDEESRLILTTNKGIKHIKSKIKIPFAPYKYSIEEISTAEEWSHCFVNFDTSDSGNLNEKNINKRKKVNTK